MSDYMFMLENHLNAAQNRVLAEVQKAAVEENVNVFLTGGAVRDMLGGFPIRDLDFTVEGNALKLAKTVAGRLGAEIISSDANRRTAELVSPEGVTFEIGMARREKYAKTAGKASSHSGNDSGRPAPQGFHDQCAGAVPEPRLARAAPGSYERHGGSGPQRTSKHRQLRFL